MMRRVPRQSAHYLESAYGVDCLRECPRRGRIGRAKRDYREKEFGEEERGDRKLKRAYAIVPTSAYIAYRLPNKIKSAKFS